MKRIVVLGAAESGVGAAILAQKEGFDVFVSDMSAIKDHYKAMLDSHGIEWEEGHHSEDKILNADEVIKSPGIPKEAPMIQKVMARNIPVISEIEFAGRYTDARMICITGSNGKTTTTSLIYHIMEKAGYDVGLAGNIGHSLALQVAETPHAWYVIELSSFQLDNMYDFHADIAVLLNITPDHLDRYEFKFENYADAKMRITQNQVKADAFIYWNDDPVIQHELTKTAVGATLYHLAGVAPEMIRQGLSDFPGVEHRLEKVCRLHGVQYINDSKATNVDACWYALESMTTPTILIVGGKDKGNDYSTLTDLVKEKCKALVYLGADNTKLHQAFDPLGLPVRDTHSMKDCVAACNELAAEGDTVLLSPCCASFDLFKNMEDRGEQFKQLVRQS